MPLSDEAKREIIRINSLTEDKLTNHGLFSEPSYLQSISYLDLLTKHFGVRNKEVILLYRDLAVTYTGSGIDAVPALVEASGSMAVHARRSP